MGVLLSIGTDSHSKETLWFLELGVGVARRGWLEKKDLLNCLTADALVSSKK
jgi:DNA polymerase (family 10)